MAMKFFILTCMYCVFWTVAGSEDLTYLHNLLGGDVPEDTDAVLDAFDAYYDGLPTREAKLVVKNNLPESVYRATAAHRRARVHHAGQQMPHFLDTRRRLSDACSGNDGQTQTDAWCECGCSDGEDARNCWCASGTSCSVNQGESQCLCPAGQVQLWLQDSWGDGWNHNSNDVGTYIKLHFPGGVSITRGINSGGFWFECMDLANLQSIELVEDNENTYTGENSFKVQHPDGTVIFEYDHGRDQAECATSDNAAGCNAAWKGVITLSDYAFAYSVRPWACPDISGQTLEQAYQPDVYLPMWRRTCASCSEENRVLYYVRKTPFVDGVDIDDYLNVIGVLVDNNVLHWDYELYDNYEDALTAARALINHVKPTLVNHGGTPSSSNTPLSECEADCDGDGSEWCESGLICFQREQGELVPGCTGNTIPSNYDVCIKPYTQTLTYIIPGTETGLKRCEGNCNDDTDCLGHLKCWSRDGSYDAPGCSGGTMPSSKVCYDPTGQVNVPQGLTSVPTRSYSAYACTGRSDNHCYPTNYRRIDGDTKDYANDLRPYSGKSHTPSEPYEKNEYPDGTSNTDATPEKRRQECAAACSKWVVAGVRMKGFLLEESTGRCYCSLVDSTDDGGPAGAGGSYQSYDFDTTPSVDWNLFADLTCSNSCANQDGIQINAGECECGSESCEANKYCHKDAGYPGKCLANPICDNQDGTQINTQACTCKKPKYELIQASAILGFSNNKYGTSGQTLEGCEQTCDGETEFDCVAFTFMEPNDGYSSMCILYSVENSPTLTSVFYSSYRKTADLYPSCNAQTMCDAGTCSKPCPTDSPATEECVCGSAKCSIGKKCIGGECLVDCQASAGLEYAKIEDKCVCGVSACDAGQYCIDNECKSLSGYTECSHQTYYSTLTTHSFANSRICKCEYMSEVSVCKSDTYCLDSVCVGQCVSTDYVAENLDCICGTSLCVDGETCRDGQCLDQCDSSKTSNCICVTTDGRTQCDVNGKICVNGACTFPPCPEIGFTNDYDCLCGGQTCQFNNTQGYKYCSANTCNDGSSDFGKSKNWGVSQIAVETRDAYPSLGVAPLCDAQYCKGLTQNPSDCICGTSFVDANRFFCQAGKFCNKYATVDFEVAYKGWWWGWYWNTSPITMYDGGVPGKDGLARPEGLCDYLNGNIKNTKACWCIEDDTVESAQPSLGHVACLGDCDKYCYKGHLYDNKVCSNTDRSIQNVDACQCEETLCSSNQYCHANTKTCHATPFCSVDTLITETCDCNELDCGPNNYCVSRNGTKYCRSTNVDCSSNVQIKNTEACLCNLQVTAPNMYCDGTQSSNYSVCSDQTGNTANPFPCSCSTGDLSATYRCDGGKYCNAGKCKTMSFCAVRDGKTLNGECWCGTSFNVGLECSDQQYCNNNSVRDTPLCNALDGVTELVSDCLCSNSFENTGSNVCSAGQYCSKTGSSGICKDTPICEFKDGIQPNDACWCGVGFGAGAACSANKYCLTDKCYEHPLCLNTDGTGLNPEKCYCSNTVMTTGLDSKGTFVFGNSMPKLYCDATEKLVFEAPYCPEYTDALYKSDPSLFDKEDCTCVLNNGTTETCRTTSSILSLLNAKDNDLDVCEFYSSRTDGKINCVRSRDFGSGTTFRENDACIVQFERDGTLRIKSMAIESKIQQIGEQVGLNNTVPASFYEDTGLKPPTDKNWLWLSKSTVNATQCKTYEYVSSGLCLGRSGLTKNLGVFQKSPPTKELYRSDAVEECMLKCLSEYSDTTFISLTNITDCRCFNASDCNAEEIQHFGLLFPSISYKIVENTLACGKQTLWTKDIAEIEDRTIDVEKGGRFLWNAGQHNGHDNPSWATGGALGFDMCLEVPNIKEGASPYCVPDYGCVESPFQCVNGVQTPLTPCAEMTSTSSSVSSEFCLLARNATDLDFWYPKTYGSKLMVGTGWLEAIPQRMEETYPGYPTRYKTYGNTAFRPYAGEGHTLESGDTNTYEDGTWIGDASRTRRRYECGIYCKGYSGVDMKAFFIEESTGRCTCTTQGVWEKFSDTGDWELYSNPELGQYDPDSGWIPMGSLDKYTTYNLLDDPPPLPQPEPAACRCGSSFCSPGEQCFLSGTDEGVCGPFFGLKVDIDISNCSPGQYLSTGETCLTCPAGYWSGAEQNDCTECAAGKYSESPGLTAETSCIECPAGYHSNDCTSHDETFFFAIPNEELENKYKYIGDGKCKNLDYSYDTRLDETNPRYDINPITECVNRCLFKDENYHFIVVEGHDFKCRCASDECLERDPSPRTQDVSQAENVVYTTYKIVKGNVGCSRKGGQTKCSACPAGTFTYDFTRGKVYRPNLLGSHKSCDWRTHVVELPNLPEGAPGTYLFTPAPTEHQISQDSVWYSPPRSGWASNYKDGTAGGFVAYEGSGGEQYSDNTWVGSASPIRQTDECAKACGSKSAKSFLVSQRGSQRGRCLCSGIHLSNAMAWKDDYHQTWVSYDIVDRDQVLNGIVIAHERFMFDDITLETVDSCMNRCRDAYPSSMSAFQVRNKYGVEFNAAYGEVFRPETDTSTCACAFGPCTLGNVHHYYHRYSSSYSWDTYNVVKTLEDNALINYNQEKFVNKLGYSRSACLSCASDTSVGANVCPKCKTTTGKRKVSEDFPGMWNLDCECGDTHCSNDAYCLVNEYGSFCNTRKLDDNMDWRKQCSPETFGDVTENVYAAAFKWSERTEHVGVQPQTMNRNGYCSLVDEYGSSEVSINGRLVQDDYCLCGDDDTAKICPKNSYCMRTIKERYIETIISYEYFCNAYEHKPITTPYKEHDDSYSNIICYDRLDYPDGVHGQAECWATIQEWLTRDNEKIYDGECLKASNRESAVVTDWFDDIVISNSDDREKCATKCKQSNHGFFVTRQTDRKCACASECDVIDYSAPWLNSNGYLIPSYRSYRILESQSNTCGSEENKYCTYLEPVRNIEELTPHVEFYTTTRECRLKDHASCNDGLHHTNWLDGKYDYSDYPTDRPVGFFKCDDAPPPIKECSNKIDTYNPGRWSTPGQNYCNACKAGYEPTDSLTFKQMAPDYEANEHIECSPCRYNEGKYSDEHGLKECKSMVGCSRGHKFEPQRVLSYTLPYEETMLKDFKFDFEGNTQKNAYTLKFKFPDYMREYVKDDLLELGGGCVACPKGFFSEISDFSENCAQKVRTCLGAYYPACARADNENHLCHGSGIFALKAESDILYRDCKHDLCANRMSFTVTNWDEDGITSSNDHANFRCMNVMSEIFLPQNNGTCIASDGSRDPDGGVRDRECYPCPAGTYSDVEDAVSCKSCPTGQFQPGRAMDLTSCIECGAGTYQDQERQTSCKYCNDSESSDVGSDSASDCVACDAGRFMSSTEVAYVRRLTGWCKNPFHTFCWDKLNPKYSDEEWRNEPSSDKDVSDIKDTCPLLQHVDISNVDNIAKTKDMIHADACANACRSFPGFIVHHAPDSPTDGRCYCTVDVHPNCDVNGVDSNVAGEWVTYAMGNEDGSQPGCTECPPGTFSGATDPLCNECPSGTFSTGGAAACTDWSDNCDLGHEAIVYPTATNDLECHECRPGFFRDNLNTVDERGNFLINESIMVPQTPFDPPKGEFVDASRDAFVPLLVQQTTTVETCVFDTLATDNEKTICPNVSELPEHMCPAGTHVYHYGSHCCRVSVDKRGDPITFTSLSCKDNNYIVCPNGNTDGSCSDTMNDFKRSGDVCSRFHYRRMFQKCTETSTQTLVKALDASDCASMCSSFLQNGDLGSFDQNSVNTHYASYKFGTDDSCYCHNSGYCESDGVTDTDYMLLEIKTSVASATLKPTYGPTADTSDNYVSGERSGMPNIANHVTYFDVAAPFRTQAFQMCEDACNALPTTKSIFMMTSKAYAYADTFEHSSVAFKPKLVNKGQNAVKYGPVQVCEGECNSDNDCAGGLVCFIRRANEPVPGCSGSISRSTNVCIRPVTPENRFYFGAGYSLCEGDCNSDAECASGLFCHFRSNGEDTPGCTGSGFVTSETDDICYDPEIYNPVIRQGIGDSVDVVQRVQCFCSSLSSEQCTNAKQTVQVKELGLSEFRSYTSNEERKITCTEHGLTSCLTETEYRAAGGTHLEDIHCETCPPGRFNRDDNIFDCEVQPCECLEDGVLTIHRECTLQDPSFCDICYQGYELKLSQDNTSDIMFGVDKYIKTGTCCSKFSEPQYNGECNWCTENECLDMVCDDGYADANHKLSDGCEWQHCASWNIASEPTQVCTPHPEKQYFDMNTLAYFVDDSLMMKEPTFKESDDSILRLAKFIKIYYDENWFGNSLRKTSDKLEAIQRTRRMVDTDIREAVDKCLQEESIYGNCKDYGKVSNFGVMSKWDVSEVTDMSLLFQSRLAFEGDLSKWNTANVVDMSGMFQDCLAFDSDITRWDVSKVRDMSYMFSNNRLTKVYMESEMDPVIQRFVYTPVESFARSSFNQDISSWDVRSVLDMTGMFMNADAFAQSLKQWKTYHVRSFEDMFRGTQHFVGDIGQWNVASVLTMAGMFAESTFNMNISDWNAVQLANASHMFYNNKDFDRQMPAMTNVMDLTSMFEGAEAMKTLYDQSTYKYATSTDIFKDATAYQQNFVCDDADHGPPSTCRPALLDDNIKDAIRDCFDISADGNCPDLYYGAMPDWKTSKVTNMSSLFAKSVIECYNLDVDISQWNTANVVDMSSMFASCTFNGDISQWNTANVIDMSSMFASSTFNQDISNWNTANVIDMSSMFASSTFNQDISNWNVASLEDATEMFNNNADFMKPLAKWNIQSSVTVIRMLDDNYREQMHCEMDDSNVVVTTCDGCPNTASELYGLVGCPIRDIETVLKWYMDGSKPYGPMDQWDTSYVTDMSGLHLWTLNVSADLSGWDVSSVTSMAHMFGKPLVAETLPFAPETVVGNDFGDLSDWDVSSVTSMEGMFERGPAVDGLRHWDVSAVTNVSKMFYMNTGFNESLMDWDLPSSGVSRQDMFGYPLYEFVKASAWISGTGDWKYPEGLTLEQCGQKCAGETDFDCVAFTYREIEDSYLSGCKLYSVANGLNLMTNIYKSYRMTPDIPDTPWLEDHQMCAGNKFCPRFTTANIQKYVDNCLEASADGKCLDLTNTEMAAWDVSEVTNMAELFKNKRTFDVDIGDWDVSEVTNMADMFYGAKFFNRNLDQWDTSKVENMDRMFFNAHEFNGIVNPWNIASVTSLKQMFYNARRFSDDITGWNYQVGLNYSHMMTGADIFHDRYECNRYFVQAQGFCTDNVGGQYLSKSECATYFGGNLTQDVKSIGPHGCYERRNWVAANDFVYNSNFASKNRCHVWNKCVCKDSFGVRPSDCTKKFTGKPVMEQYELRKAVDDCLEEDPVNGQCTSWAAKSGLGVMSTWNTEKITNMERLFKGRRQFNADISGWDVHNVKTMREMFMNAIEFKGDISQWEFATNMNKENMFKNARAFFLHCEETKCFKFFKQ
ncbi:BspA family leucine-rich repeat surface protein [bacterium]|nr:BspA family leucine-rich repeat surface protein [bacterium]